MVYAIRSYYYFLERFASIINHKLRTHLSIESHVETLPVIYRTPTPLVISLQSNPFELTQFPITPTVPATVPLSSCSSGGQGGGQSDDGQQKQADYGSRVHIED